MKETNQVICLSKDEGVIWGKIYNTLTPTDNDGGEHGCAVVINENDERHELLPNEYHGYYGPEHLKGIAHDQIDTDLTENRLQLLIKYTYKDRR